MMKRLLTISLPLISAFTMILITLLFTGTATLSPGEVYGFSEKGDCQKCHTLTKDEALKILKDAIPDVKVLKIINSPLRGLWEVDFESQGRKGLVYIDYTKRFIFAGSIFEIATKQNLTQERFAELNRVDPSKIDLRDALVMGKRNAKYRVIVFTDPDCPFCARLHNEMKKILNMRSDIAFYIKLFPLKIHPQAYEKSRIIVCERSLKLLEAAYEGKEVKGKRCNTKEIDKNLELGNRLGINGTPAIILPNGRIHQGYLPAEELIRLITGT